MVRVTAELPVEMAELLTQALDKAIEHLRVFRGRQARRPIRLPEHGARSTSAHRVCHAQHAHAGADQQHEGAESLAQPATG